MTLSEFTFRIILLFIPGIISFAITDRLISHKETPIHKVVMYVLLYGFMSYMLYYLLFVKAINYICSGRITYKFGFSFISSLSSATTMLSFNEILIVAALSVPMGFAITYFVNASVLFKFAYKIRATRKFGDVDVWNYIMNNEKQEWFIVRDLDYDLMYEGWVSVFSDIHDKNEIFLKDVKVYRNSTGDKLYETPGLYLPRSRKSLTIEIPTPNPSNAGVGDSKEEEVNE